MKKSLLLILLSIFSFATIHAKITWTLSDDGTLTISGTEMPNYTSDSSTPWYSQRNKIQKVVIEDGMTNIGNYAFCRCNQITSITLPNSLTTIGIYAFLGCTHLTSITIPNSVTTIGAYAFYCSALTSISIPNSVREIESWTFYACSHLTSISIPSSVTYIGQSAFGGCKSLSTVTIPNSVTYLGDHAFTECASLTSITLPNSVTSIEDFTFNECYSLTSITLPNSVTSIKYGAFWGCSSLTSITISKNVYIIGIAAFTNCSALTSITIPLSVQKIEKSAFTNCSALTSITCEASIPPTCVYNEGKHSFYNVDTSIPLYVPTNSVDAYKEADVWKEFTNIQAIPSTSLTDGTPYTNNLQLNGRDVSYTRTFNNTAWQSLYIPFSLNYNDWKDDFEVAYINGVRQLDKDDNGTIDETIMDVIKIKSGSTTPNMPYLIKAKTTGEKTFSVNDATLYPAEENSVDCSTTIAKYTFTGTYSSIPSETMIANNYYAMGGGDLIQSDGSNDLKPYRWYMKVESRNPSYNVSNAAKIITINVIGDEEEETTTGVKELRITNDELPVYDINGRMVSDKNLKPGLYIKNGKKFVVK